MCKHVHGLMGNHLARVSSLSCSWEWGNLVHIRTPARLKPISISARRASDLNCACALCDICGTTVTGLFRSVSEYFIKLPFFLGFNTMPLIKANKTNAPVLSTLALIVFFYNFLWIRLENHKAEFEYFITSYK